MSVTDIPLLNQIKGRLGWLDDRQRVIAQNVANSDTPGFMARDLKAPTDFAEAMRTGGGLRMVATNARHITPAGQTARFESLNAPDSETTRVRESMTTTAGGFAARPVRIDRSIATVPAPRSAPIFRTFITASRRCWRHG